MMLDPSVNKLREKVDSRYTLCMLAAKRARDLIAKKPALTEVQSERPVSQAANEIAEDLITYRRVEEPEEAVEAETEAEETACEECTAEGEETEVTEPEA